MLQVCLSSLLAGGTEASQCSLSATGGARRRSTTKQGNLRKGARAIDNKKVKSEARFANGRIPMLCLVQTGRAALIALQVKTNPPTHPHVLAKLRTAKEDDSGEHLRIKSS